MQPSKLLGQGILGVALRLWHRSEGIGSPVASAVDTISPRISEIELALLRSKLEMAVAVGSAVEQQTSTSAEVAQSLNIPRRPDEVSGEIEEVRETTCRFMSDADEIGRRMNQLAAVAHHFQQQIETFFCRSASGLN